MLNQQFHGSFIADKYKSNFVNQIRTANFMALLRLARNDDAEETYACLAPICRSPNEELEMRKATLVDTITRLLIADPGAIIPNVCNCENLLEAVCCNANYALIAEEYYQPTHQDFFF
jgi:hypothetical protein